MKRVTTNTMMLKICVVPPDLCAHVNTKNDSCAVVRAVLWENYEDWALTSIRVAGN